MRFGPDRILRGLRALADEERLRVVELLGERSLDVAAIARSLGAPRARVRRHVATLRRAGLVLVAHPREVVTLRAEALERLGCAIRAAFGSDLATGGPAVI